jgi:hypothetical protein
MHIARNLTLAICFVGFAFGTANLVEAAPVASFQTTSGVADALIQKADWSSEHRHYRHMRERRHYHHMREMARRHQFMRLHGWHHHHSEHHWHHHEY